MNLKNNFMVTLIRPPFVLPSTSHQAQRGVPPLGLAYLVGALKHNGYSVNCIDSTGEKIGKYTPFGNSGLMVHGLSISEVVDRIPAATRIIGISCMYANEWLFCKLLIKQIKEKFPKLPIILGGEFVTADYEYLLRHYSDFDLCVLGEGEETLVDLIECFFSSKAWNDVSGIAFKTLDNNIIVNPRRPRIHSIDKISLPDWSALPLENYLSSGRGNDTQSKRSMPLLASRGCPYKCSFCTSPNMWTRLWKARQPEQVVDEMKLYINKYRIEHFEFYDLTIMINPTWLKNFCTTLRKEKLNVTWSLPTGTRTEVLSLENLRLLKESGCRKITLSPESGSAKTLERMHKKLKPHQMLKVISDCRQVGIITKCNLIFGLPEQTLVEVLESYIYILKMAWYGADDVACFSFVPYPGSELFDKLVSEKKIVRDFEYEDFLSRNIYNNTKNLISWSEHIKNWQMPYLVIGGMGLFYVTSFVLRPFKLFRLFARLLRGKPVTMLEMLIFGIIEKSYNSKK
jgi:anaerobic magnesium-protoporphyrin IX monomethyl ester cyclase